MKQTSEENLGKKKLTEESCDNLTGALTKNAAEAQITGRLNETHEGTLFLCNVDGMKRINEQYGHLTGDECLKRVARILSYLIRQDDIMGRRSGDEFEIFMPGCRDTHLAQEICKRIHNRFRTSEGDEEGSVPLSVTVVWEQVKPQDTLAEVLMRTDAEMRRQKEALETLPAQVNKENGYIKDVKQVRKELVEQIQQPGAYCQDFETFKGIYRFLARSIIRSGQKACVILITLVNEDGKNPSLYEKDALMEQLGDTIGSTLRVGDVYARYSSNQYLLLVIDTTEGQADKVVKRIREQFLAGRRRNDVLIHSCYDLKPTQIGGFLGMGGGY